MKFKVSSIIGIFIILLSLNNQANEQISPNQQTVMNAIKKAGANSEEIKKCFEKVSTGAPKKELSFLIANMPEHDLQTLSSEFIMANIKLACEARKKAPWGANIPEDIFLNDVLPYCVLNEKRDSVRKKFFELFHKKAWEFKTPGEAAVYLNNTVFKKINVKYHPTKRKKPHQSSAESIKIGFASCTGLSIILVDACRAVGIPARIAGIPAWKDKKGNAQGLHAGNHNWVEIWDNGKWHHLGASEPSKLNKTWFTAKTATASDKEKWYHKIYGSSYKKTGIHFPMVWDLSDKSVPAIDVNEYYQSHGWDKD